MRQERARVSLAVLAGLVAWSVQALAGAPAAKPGTAAPAKPDTAAAAKPATAVPVAPDTAAAPEKKDPLAELLKEYDSEVADRIALIANPAESDEKRVKAREELVTDRALLAKKSIDALIDLGKAVEGLDVGDEQKPYIRLQVVIALSQIRQRREADKVVANYPLLKGWMDAKDGDAGVRHWAALAIANTRTPEALSLLEGVLTAPDGDPTAAITCRAVAVAVGEWRKGSLEESLPVLLKMATESKNDVVRIAGIDGLRTSGANRATVIQPLADIAAKEPTEPVWRAAERALNELTKGWPISRLSIPVGATLADRKELVRVWMYYWEREAKKRAGQ
jgi:hypothetical protein